MSKPLVNKGKFDAFQLIENQSPCLALVAIGWLLAIALTPRGGAPTADWLPLAPTPCMISERPD